MTALHWAAYAGAPEAARILIEHGADAKLVDQKGKTALDYARENGNHPELVALLEKAMAARN
jgi:ankyrin repeat protein